MKMHSFSVDTITGDDETSYKSVIPEGTQLQYPAAHFQPYPSAQVYSGTQAYHVAPEYHVTPDYTTSQQYQVYPATPSVPVTQDYQVTPLDPTTQESPVTPGTPDTDCRTPSPADSGIDTTISPTADHVDKTLDSLSKKSEALIKPVVTSEKPPHSFLAIVSMAILSAPDRKMVLGDIYKYVIDNFPFYNNQEKAWRNSVRHNLSLNECFVKNGPSNCGKGNYWSIHTAVEEDFAKGDFRRRQARRKSRAQVKSVNSEIRKPIGYVDMTTSSIGYHPYSTASYYPHPTRTDTTSGLQQTTPVTTSAASNYALNSDTYRYSYPASTTTPTSLADIQSPSYYTQFQPASYDVTSHPAAYTSGMFSSSQTAAKSVDAW